GTRRVPLVTDSMCVPGARPHPKEWALAPAALAPGTVMPASIFQLASMAARSMVRMPPASVGSEAAGGRLAGRRLGSWTVMVEVYGEARCGRLGQASKTLRVLGARVATAATDLDRAQMDV